MEAYTGAHSTGVAVLVEGIPPTHGSRHKWCSQQENLKDDTVVVTDQNAARKDWKVGKIVRTCPGGNGLVRVVDVKAGDRILKR